VRAALEFAAQAHGRIDQRRKYTFEPYIVHPVEVARLTLRYDPRIESLMAALCHDVLEDTPVTYDELVREFGDEVAHLVGELTDVATKADGNRAARNAIECARLARASSQAKTIKLMDIASNVRSVVTHDPKFARVYLPEKAEQLKALEGGHPGAVRLARHIHAAAEQRLLQAALAR